MLALILTSCSALKLSDPSNLRTEDNVSLRSWCKGVGCVMPFTPASCLSWCDWNVDKQSDAESRGAFASKAWGDAQKTAKQFFITIADSSAAGDCETDADKISKYYFVDKKGAIMFPGGDKETQYKETELNCGECYHMKTNAASVAKGRLENIYLKFWKTVGVHTSKYKTAKDALEKAKTKEAKTDESFKEAVALEAEKQTAWDNRPKNKLLDTFQEIDDRNCRNSFGQIGATTHIKQTGGNWKTAIVSCGKRCITQGCVSFVLSMPLAGKKVVKEDEARCNLYYNCREKCPDATVPAEGAPNDAAKKCTGMSVADASSGCTTCGGKDYNTKYKDMDDVFGLRNAEVASNGPLLDALNTAKAKRKEWEQELADARDDTKNKQKALVLPEGEKGTEVSSSVKLYKDIECVTEEPNSGYEMIKRKDGVKTIKGATDDGYKVCRTFPAGKGDVRRGFSMEGIVPPGKCEK